MNNLSLKRATLKDSDQIAELEKIASSPTYSARLTDQEVKDAIKKENIFLIKKGKTVIGLVAYQVIKKKTAHFDGLVITPKFRRQGFAQEAMALMLKKMPKYSRVDLVVHPHNSPAISIYLKLGFTIESWSANHFGDGEPRLVMAK